MAEGVPTNNQRGRRSGPCRLWGGLDKARHIVPTALLVRVQCFRKSLHKAVQGPSTRPIVVSMINGSYCRRRRRLTIFEPDEMKIHVSSLLMSSLHAIVIYQNYFRITLISYQILLFAVGPQSLCNRNYGGVFVLSTGCWIFCWHKGFRNRTESDVVVFLFTCNEALYNVIYPSVSRFLTTLTHYTF